MKVNFIINGQPCVTIVAENRDIPRFAAEELQRYLERITGCRLPLAHAAEADRPSVFIGSPEWCRTNAGSDFLEGEVLRDDGYYSGGVNGNFVLTSKLDRGLLFAVYALLEEQGCRWFFPGEAGEKVPSTADIRVPERNKAVNPDYAKRSYMDAGSETPYEVWSEEILELIDWCAKAKMNAVFIHHEPTAEFPEIAIVREALDKRGMLFEYGGHGTQHFIDRSLFDDKPELFREKDGVRRKDGNFCGSNEEAIRMVVEGVEEVVRRNPGLDVLHLFFDDVYDGSWCSCEHCRSMSIPDQVVNVMNRVIAEVGKKDPDLRGDVVLYHDTLDTSGMQLEPHPRLIGFFAPRERCYAHSIGDPSCPRNVEYMRNVREAVSKFGDRIDMSEYYTDMILYSKMTMHIPHVIAEDLRQYKQAGVNMVTQLSFLRYSWWAYRVNLYISARCSWDVEYDPSEGLKEWCDMLYPNHAAGMLAYQSLLEQASFGILTFCEYGELNDIRNIPPQVPEFQKKHMEQIKTSIGLYEQGLDLLEKMLGASEGQERARILEEKQLLQITIQEAEAVYSQMMGRFMLHTGEITDAAAFDAWMDDAIRRKTELKSFIETIPVEVKGCGGLDCFPKHLCDDQITFLEAIKKQAAHQVAR